MTVFQFKISTPKTLKLVNFSHGSEIGAKNSYGSYPTEFVPEVKNTKITPVRPIPSVIQKEKCLTWKDLSKIGRTKFSFGQLLIHGRVTDFFFRKNLFFSDKNFSANPINSSRTLN
jgi:hypothetical protein